MSDRNPSFSDRYQSVYLRNMRDYATDILNFTHGLDRDTFRNDRKTYYAVLWALGVVGEAAPRVSEEIREAHPEILWVTLRGLRNRIVHEYGEIDDDEIWEVVSDTIPDVVSHLNRLLGLSTDPDPRDGIPL